MPTTIMGSFNYLNTPPTTNDKTIITITRAAIIDKNITLFVKKDVNISKKLEDNAVKSSGVIPRVGNNIRITIKPTPIHTIDNTHK
jgi:hypothetical protein